MEGVSLPKTKTVHLYKSHGDHRSAGQSQFDYDHSTACGYVRDVVSRDVDQVTCKLCLRDVKASVKRERV